MAEEGQKVITDVELLTLDLSGISQENARELHRLYSAIRYPHNLGIKARDELSLIGAIGDRSGNRVENFGEKVEDILAGAGVILLSAREQDPQNNVERDKIIARMFEMVGRGKDAPSPSVKDTSGENPSGKKRKGGTPKPPNGDTSPGGQQSPF